MSAVVVEGGKKVASGFSLAGRENDVRAQEERDNPRRSIAADYWDQPASARHTADLLMKLLSCLNA